MEGVSATPRAGAQPIDQMKARVEAEQAGRPFLLYEDGDGKPWLFTFEPGATSTSVGRDRSADLVLHWDGEVSRLHARLERDGDDWDIVDDGLSRNGTFVNGERLARRRRLSDGDSLRFGTTTVIFRSPRPADQPGPGSADPVAAELSTSQLRVLVALCRPYKEGAFATPATDQQIADELFTSAPTVRTHLGVLFAKLGVDQLPGQQQRSRLVERAFSTGLVTERDL
jgi:pSer/pThr/pTyr-binding forkhead associated (FHA) protein